MQQRRRRSRPLIEESDDEDNDNHQHSQKRSRAEETSKKSYVLRYTQNATRRIAKRVIDEIRDDISEAHPLCDIGIPNHLIDKDRDSKFAAPPEGMLEDIPERLSVPKNQTSISFEMTQSHQNPNKDRSVFGNEDENMSLEK